MSTTDILFNSPALHSLKRAQLVQLCKRHNIKASGKNVELVARLKEHARNLPSETPLSIAVRSEAEPDGDVHDGVLTDISDEDNVEDQLTSPEKERESQMWEVVSRGSLDSKGSIGTREFSAATNSKPTILKSIASSMGLARSPSSNSIPAGDSSDSSAPPPGKKDKELSSSPRSRSIFSSLMPHSRASSNESHSKNKDGAQKSLTTRAIPYNKIPMPSVSKRPQVEPFAFSYAGIEDTSLVSEVSIDTLDRPVPGIGLCSSTKVKNGMGTVRLVTTTDKPSEGEEEVPKLTPVIPAFDLIPPTPGKPGPPRFPAATPETRRTLYPIISSDDRDINLETLTSPTRKPSKVEVDKSLPALPELSPISPTTPKDAFIFGSPNPRHSTAAEDFSNAASSVLAEMNARLGAAGGRTVDSTVLTKATGKRTKVDIETLMKYEFGGKSEKDKENETKANEGSLSKKFDKLHEKAFSKMDGIDKHYAAKRVLKNKEKEKLEPLPDNRKRKQSTVDRKKSIAPAQAKKVAAENTVIIPGAFELDDVDMDDSVVRIEATEEHEEHKDEHIERSAKRACVEEVVPGSSGEIRRISIVPKARKDASEDEEETDEEKKRKQSEAIKRRLEINKARRRSSRGLAPRTPNQKQKGFLASAKSFVRSVWNRGGNAPVTKSNSSGPSYLKATASSSSRGPEQDSKSVAAPTKPAVSRASSVRSPNIGAGIVARKPSSSQKQGTSKPGLETVAEGEPEKGKGTSVSASAPVPEDTKADQNQAAIFGSVQPRKPSSSGSLLRAPSVKSDANAAASKGTVGRSSRLLAPTASSLAKAVASPSKSTAAKSPTARARASVISPSKIPVFSPLNKKQGTGTAGGKRIFGTPLVLPSSPQARSAAEKGQDINPITGTVSPQRQRVPFSNANVQTQSLAGAAAALKNEGEDTCKVKVQTSSNQNQNQNQNASPTKINKTLNSLRKPRISRSRVVAKIGNVASPRRGPFSSNKPTSRSAAASGTAGGSGSGSGSASGAAVPSTPKVRSSTAIAVRRSLGGAKARESTANTVQLSAKKRARTTEYARRKSAKTPIRGPDFRRGDAMEIDG